MVGHGSRLLWIVSAAALVASCTARVGGSDGGTPSSSGGGSAISSGGTSAGASQGTGSTGGSVSTGSGTSSGSTTGPIPSPYFDGGYVFCSDALPDGGAQRWMCQPGSYFCEPGAPGTCSQCRGDSDCADTSLPTYDPRRPRCDLDSGVAGYQGFCQQCIGDSDCPNAIGLSHCDLNPTFPASAAQPPIVTLGFEACGPLETDCRRLDGPVCRAFGQRCDQANGRCVDFPNPCLSDQDCAGRFDTLVAPFCVNGACQACDGGVCFFGNRCFSDADCGNPDSLSTGLFCDLNQETCVCTDSAQCGGYWPRCVGLDGGWTTPGGQAEGLCGCDDDAQCGDGGLVCLFGGFCGLPCYSPEGPTCGSSACSLSWGICGECTTNASCESSFGSNGPICLPDPNSTASLCACVTDGDCAYGYACQDLACVPALPHCSPSTCGGYFCNWATGVCAQADDPTITRCLEDYDCAHGGHCKAGSCYACFQNSDCIAFGPSDRTLCCHDDPACTRLNYLESSCAPVCHVDADCIGNTNGPKCDVDGGVFLSCGCASDADCAESSLGTHCVTDPASLAFGICACASSAQCPAGDACEFASGGDGGYGTCTAYCYPSSNLICQAGFTCDADYRCRPRCDERFSCAAPDLQCDLTNIAGQNGAFGGYDGVADAGGATWCYQCLDSRDCDGRLGCVDNSCQSCGDAGDCYAGTVCASDGLCHATCDTGTCPAGQLCDVYDRAGQGNVCFDCLSSADCPSGEGCDSRMHTCGSCEGATDGGWPSDCPPDAICSTYWIGGTGVCLQNCDRERCPPSAPLCAVFPALTPDHSYCFGCQEDGDCADGGRCDTSILRTFQCLPGPGP